MTDLALITASAVPRHVRPTCPQDEVDGDGFFNDVHAQPVDEQKPWREDKTRDVSAFFGPPKSVKSSNGKQWNVCDCQPCQYVSPTIQFIYFHAHVTCHSKKGQSCKIVNEGTTCRRHLAYKHKVSTTSHWDNGKSDNDIFRLHI